MKHLGRLEQQRSSTVATELGSVGLPSTGTQKERILNQDFGPDQRGQALKYIYSSAFELEVTV